MPSLRLPRRAAG